MVRSRQRLDIDIEELDRLLDRTREGPLSDAEREKLRTALHVLAEKASLKTRTTEKTRAVVKLPALTDEAGAAADKQRATRKGHGRIRSNGLCGSGEGGRPARRSEGRRCPARNARRERYTLSGIRRCW